MQNYYGICLVIVSMLIATGFAYASEEQVPATLVSFEEIDFEQFKHCVSNYNKATLIDSFSRKTKHGTEELIYIAKYKTTSLFEIDMHENEILINKKITRNEYYKMVESLVHDYPGVFLVIVVEFDKRNSRFIINKISLGHEYFSFFNSSAEHEYFNDQSIVKNICKNRHLFTHVLSLDAFRTALQKMASTRSFIRH